MMKFNKRTLHTIALVGMDGSGKSTQSIMLSKIFSQWGAYVYLIHPFGYKFLSLVAKQLPPQPTAGQRRPGTPGLLRRLAAYAEVLDTALYLWLVYLRCKLIMLLSTSPIWLISDRSFQDVLIKHHRLRTLSVPTIRFLQRLVPRVDVTIWLHTDPDVALLRDGEFDRTYYQEMYQTYLNASEQCNWQVVTTAGLSREAICKKILEKLYLRESRSSI